MTRKHLIPAGAALLLTLLSLPAWADVNAELSDYQISDGESVQLTLTRDSRGGARPDLSPLEKDFQVLSTSSGTSMQIINGQVSTKTQLTLTLMPRHSGTLQVPSIDWNGEKSPSLVLVVSDSGSSNSSNDQGGSNVSAGAQQHVFLRSTVDTPSPYVQGAVVLTVRLYADRPLYQASLTAPTSDDAMIESFGKDEQSQQVVNGHSYTVVERQYLVTPQKSGKITLKGPVLDAQIAARDDNSLSDLFGSMMTQTRPLQLRGDDVSLSVRPRPDSWTGRDWLAADEVSLTESWDPDGDSVHVGEPLTRHLTLNAVGVTGDALPDLAAMMPVPDGVKAYPDQADTNSGVQNGRPTGLKTQNIALIPSRPGKLLLPEMTLSWWDVNADKQRQVTLPAHTITVLPAVGGAAAAAPATASTASAGAAATSGGGSQAEASAPLAVPAPAGSAQSMPDSTAALWRWLSLALGSGWLLTVLAWIVSARRRRPGSPATPPAKAPTMAAADAKAEKAAFVAACQADDPNAARRHLLAWARAENPTAVPAGLGALASALGDDTLAAALERLDRACYAGGEWQGAELANKLTSVRLGQGKRARGSALGSLYS